MTIKGLQFKMQPASKLRKNSYGVTKITDKLVEGVAFMENGIFKIHVELNDPDHSKLVLEFTVDSYNLHGREVVFDKVPDAKFGRGIYVRREREYKYSPGVPIRYTTLCENCVFNGYVVRDNKTKKLMFKMNRFVRRYGTIYERDGTI